MSISTTFRAAGVSLLAMGATLAAVPTFAAGPAPIAGVWDATVTVKDNPIPFKLQLTTEGGAVKATYFDGERPVRASTGGSFRNGDLHVDFASYAAKLDARLEGGVLHGTIGALPFEARRHTADAPAKKAPPIAGVWEIPLATPSPKGEKAWRLIVDQKPTGTYASILRIDGDTGTISGKYDGSSFNLSRFAGERPMALKISPQRDGTLALTLTDAGGRTDYRALRPAEARKAGLAAPNDPTKFTSASRAESFRFSGKELATGKTVSNLDPRFKGKVVLLNIMGSWCPNCHDEAPFLAELDAKYRSRGLQIIALDFESTPDQITDPARLKAFVARYGLKYPVLIAGVRSEVNGKLPQAENLNAWPTSFFIGRDGKAHSTHTGFPSRGSGAYERQARAEIVREIETLLAEKS